MERDIDLKIAALSTGLEGRIGDTRFIEDVRRERAEGSIFIEIQQSLERTNQTCVDNARSIRDIQERLAKLEERLGTAHEGGEREIEDDFSS